MTVNEEQGTSESEGWDRRLTLLDGIVQAGEVPALPERWGLREESRGMKDTSFERIVARESVAVRSPPGNGGLPNREHQVRSGTPAPCPVVKPRVFITMGEHPWVPGVPMRVFGSKPGADEEAARLVNIIRIDSLDECPDIPEATGEHWGSIIQQLSEHHGEEGCWVEVTEHEVHP